MANEDKKNKTSDASKSETAVKKKGEVHPKDKSTPDVDLSKAKDSDKSTESPSNYSRGEGQKAVSKAYKDNWNEIYAKKKKR